MSEELVLECQELVLELDVKRRQAAMDQDEKLYNRYDDVWHKAMTRYKRRYYAWKAATTS